MLDEHLLRALDIVCRPAALQRAATVPAWRTLSLPAGSAVWFGYHAVLVVVPASDAFEKRAGEATVWLGGVLDDWRQTTGRVVNGYLAMALPAEPEDPLRAECAAYELKTAVCRRHVLWPVEGRWSARIAEITIVSLPAAAAIAPPEAGAQLPAAAEACLELLRDPRAKLSVVWTRIDERIQAEARGQGTDAI